MSDRRPPQRASRASAASAGRAPPPAQGKQEGSSPEGTAGASRTEGTEARKGGLLSRFLGLLALGPDPERDKRRMLKAIAQDVRRQRVKYFDPRTGSAEPALARFFYAFYKTLGPARTLLEAAESSESLKTTLVEVSLSADQLELREKLTEAGIQELAETMHAAALAAEVKSALGRFSASFGGELVQRANERMYDFAVLLDLIAFDYLYVLRKFDPQFPRNDYTYTPAFGPVEAGEVSNDLKDLLEILVCVNPDSDWDGVLNALREYRSMDVFSREGWEKLLELVRRLNRSKLLLNVIRLIDKDPFATVPAREYGRHAAEDYIEKIRVQAELALQKVLARKRSERTEELAAKVFGKPPAPRLSQYLESANPAYAKRMVSGFTHTVPLNYLAAYLADYLAGETKGLVDMLLIKGRWTVTPTAREISESIQTLALTAQQIEEFDQSLREEGSRGQKLKAAIARSSRNKKELYVLRQTLRLVNESARTLVDAGGRSLVGFGKLVKLLLDDMESPEPRVLLNWRDVDAVADHELRKRLVTVYTRVYNVVQLLMQFKNLPVA